MYECKCPSKSIKEERNYFIIREGKEEKADTLEVLVKLARKGALRCVMDMLMKTGAGRYQGNRKGTTERRVRNVGLSKDMGGSVWLWMVGIRDIVDDGQARYHQGCGRVADECMPQ